MAKKDQGGAFMQAANFLYDVGSELARRVRERRAQRAKDVQNKGKKQ